MLSFFRLVLYFFLSDLSTGFAAGGDSAPTDSLVVLPALGLGGSGGETPPLASRLAAIFCSRASSALSRLDMIPSFGGRPGPRRRAGWPLSPGSIDAVAFESESLFLSSFDDLEMSLLSLSLRSRSISSSISCSASTEPSASSSSAGGSSRRSAPVSPTGTSGSRKRMRTPPI